MEPVAHRHPDPGRIATIAMLGVAQTLAWGSTYYLPAIIAVQLAEDLQLAPATVFAAFSGALVVAALIGPRAGRAIDTFGGRPVLAGTSIVFAAGLGLLGIAESLAGLLAAWAVIGLGMGAGLYEGAFAALVRLYGSGSRASITGITLIAGFASTVGWPATTWLQAEYGWRTACFAWAAIHLLVGLPLNLALPKVQAQPAARVAAGAQVDAAAPDWKRAGLLAFVFAATWFTSTAMAAHLPRLLQECGASLVAAVAVGALIGPSQVAARLLEFGLLRRMHPLLSARLAAAMHPLGAAVVFGLGAPAAVVFGVLHGAGNGILTIAKGTLPLVLFGPQGYGHRQGVLMVPARFAQAMSPWLFGMALDSWGSGALVLSGSVGLAAFGALLLLRVGEGHGQAAAGRHAG